MEKLIGKKKISIAVFISGRGSNLKSIINFTKRKSNFKVRCVVSDNRSAKGLELAKKEKIKYLVVNFKKYNQAENRVLKFLQNKNIQIIALAGFMKILSKLFIKRFHGIILNIHPSLLPKYKGLNTHKRVLENKEKYSGCTVHLVNEKLDSGKILIQKKVKISNNDTSKSLSKKVLKAEHLIYPETIERICLNL